MTAPPTGAARVLGAVDDAGDTLFGWARGRRAADVAAAVVSNLSDYGLIWVAVAAAQSRRSGPRRRRAVLGLAGAGIMSYSVNRVVKRAVNRGRPTTGHLGLPVRRPTSSSFPSGHTLAAWCTAVSLTDGPVPTAAAAGFATAVALSRVHLGAHHLSDVAGGAVIGTGVGLVVRAVLDRVAPLPGE